MSVGRICVREVDVAGPEEVVLSAAQRIVARDVGTLVVLDDAKHPIGVVTDRDLVRRVLAPGKDPRCTRVAEVMTQNPKVVDEESAIETALAIMRAGAFRRLPVVSGSGQLVGIVSLDDILALLAEEFMHIGSIVERRR